MVEIRSRYWLFTRREVFFPDSEEVKELASSLHPCHLVELVRCGPGTPAEVGAPGVLRRRITETLWLDITREDALLAGMDPTTRRNIRRAAAALRDIVIERNSLRLQRHFASMYNDFAQAKGNLRVLTPGGASAVRENCDLFGVYRGNDLLVAHATLCDRPRRIARLYLSASRRLEPQGRAPLGELNRYLHFHEFATWRAEGLTTYDFCGTGRLVRPSSGLAQFKMGFGGTIVPQVVETLAGHLGTVCIRARKAFAAISTVSGSSPAEAADSTTAGPLP